MLSVKINELLEQKGKTMYWLSKQTNISPNGISKICNNETNTIRFDTLEKICLALQCTPNDIITSTNPILQNFLDDKQ